MKRAIVKGTEKEESILFRLREDGKKVFKEVPFHNYFFLKKNDYDDVEYLIQKYVLKTEDVMAENGDFVRVVLKNNYSRYKCKMAIDEAGYSTYEADLTSVKRFLVDNPKLELNQKDLKYCFMDIETFDEYPLEKDFSGTVAGSHPILSVAFKDLDGNVKYIVNEAYKHATFEEAKENLPAFIKLLKYHEKKLLEEYIEIAKEYDSLLAWNGQNFDFAYLKDRFTAHGLRYDDMMTISLDYMLVYKGFLWGSLKSYSLNNVSKHELAEEIGKENTKFGELDEVQKIDWKEKTGLKKFWHLYMVHPELLKEYNIQDVNLMYMIEQKLNYLHLCDVICNETHSLVAESIYNSKALDNRMLIEYRKENLIAPSKPTNAEMEKRKLVKISGGYTYVFQRGLFYELICDDFKSSYPCHIVTYNISPETFVEELEPKLSLVFDEKEIEYISYCVMASDKFLDAKGALKKKKYDEDIEKKRLEIGVRTMEELMYHFVEHYDTKLEGFTSNLKARNLISTPADINYDTNGWHIHPHRLFTTKEGILPRMEKDFLIRRDEVKYKLKQFEYHSSDWWEHHFYQNGLKTLANSAYGAFGFKSFRFFMKEIADSITSSARWSMKKSVICARELNCSITHGDTDSSYLNLGPGLTIEQLDKTFYDLYDEVVKPYNTKCQIELVDPITKEKKIKNHFIVYEYEKTFKSCIVVAKKRYYYKEQKGDNFIYETMGGAYKKKDTMPYAAELQKELCKMILDDEFDKEKYVAFLKELKTKVYNFELEEKHLVMSKALSKNPSEYGGPVIDGKTGLPKIKKSNGKIQQRPIPCHVKIAMEMLEKGQEITVGDGINYVIVNQKPRQEGITLEDYRENKRYDADYYYERIEAPIIEILSAVYPQDVYTTFKDCWHYSEKQLERLQEKMMEEFEAE